MTPVQRDVEVLQSTVDSLGDRCLQFESEMEIVAWYIEIMEQGMDTRSIMKDYLKTKKELD